MESYTTGSAWLSVEQVAQRYEVSSASIWRWVRQGRFPKPVKIGPRSTRWRRKSIDDHDAKISESAA